MPMSVTENLPRRFVAEASAIRRLRWYGLAGAGIGVVLLALSLVSDEDLRLLLQPVGLAVLAISLLLLAVGPRMRRRPPTLEVTTDGLAVQFTRSQRHFVSWADMTDVRVREVLGSPVLELGTREGAQVTYGRSIPRPCPDDPGHLRFFDLAYLSAQREACLSLIEAVSPVPVLRPAPASEAGA